MKTILLMLLLTVSLIARAATVSEADALYAARGTDTANALKAATMYGELASSKSTNMEIANMKNGEAKSLFYYTSNFLTKKKEKLVSYEKAYTAADVAVKAMSGAVTVEEKTVLARSLYNYAANLGKWGETKGIIASLGKWNELRYKSLAIITNDETVAEFGAYRILGKAFIKVPSFKGVFDERGYAYLEKAYHSSIVDINDVTATTNIANLTYLIWAAKKLKKEDEFCYYYDDAMAVKDEIDADSSVLDQFYPNLKAETVKDLEEVATDRGYIKYYDRKC